LFSLFHEIENNRRVSSVYLIYTCNCLDQRTWYTRCVA